MSLRAALSTVRATSRNAGTDWILLASIRTNCLVAPIEVSTFVNQAVADTAVDHPTPELRPYISRYAGFQLSGLPRGIHFGLPSSNVNLIISLDRSIDLVQMPASTQPPAAFSALVSGLHDAPALVRQCEDAFGLHVFIKPLGVCAILGVASADISSLAVNLSDIWRGHAEDLVEVLRAADSWKERFAILDRTFVSRLKPIKAQSEMF